MSTHHEDPWIVVATQDDWTVGVGPFRTEAEAEKWIDLAFEWGIGWAVLPFDEALPLIEGELLSPDPQDPSV